jgi:hypothetical protein
MERKNYALKRAEIGVRYGVPLISDTVRFSAGECNQLCRLNYCRK